MTVIWGSSLKRDSAEDFMGKVIRVKDLIVYPVRQGSNLWMNQAVVIKIESSDKVTTIHAERPDGTVVKLTKTENIVIVTAPIITISK